MTTQKQKTFATTRKSIQALKVLTFVVAGCVGWSALAQEANPEIPGRYPENKPLSVLSKGDKIILTNRANPGKEETVENRALRFTNEFENDLSKLVAIRFFNKKKYDSASLNKLPKELLQKINTQGEICTLGAFVPSPEQSSAEIFNTLENHQLEITLTDSPTIEDIEGTGKSRISFHFKPIDIMINNKLRVTIASITCKLVNNSAVVNDQYQIKDLNATFGEHAIFVRGNDSSKKVLEEKPLNEQQQTRPSKRSKLHNRT